MKLNYNDGGRQAAGYKGQAGDCVVRAIAIATEKPYQEIYNAINEMGKAEHITKKKRDKSTARDGVYKQTERRYLQSIGWKWTPTMFIGQGCKVHLRSDELPSGRIIAVVSRHTVAVIDGVINDLNDPSRGGTRCVYGYYQKI